MQTAVIVLNNNIACDNNNNECRQPYLLAEAFERDGYNDLIIVDKDALTGNFSTNINTMKTILSSVNIPVSIYLGANTVSLVDKINQEINNPNLTAIPYTDTFSEEKYSATDFPASIIKLKKKEQVSLSFDDFKLDANGLIPVVVVDNITNEVLMMAYMNKEAYEKTVETGIMTYYSRSRQELWIKGLTSGHFQYVSSLDIDCDCDTILARVKQIGAACHTGNRSCFYRNLYEK